MFYLFVFLVGSLVWFLGLYLRKLMSQSVKKDNPMKKSSTLQLYQRKRHWFNENPLQLPISKTP